MKQGPRRGAASWLAPGRLLNPLYQNHLFIYLDGVTLTGATDTRELPRGAGD